MAFNATTGAADATSYVSVDDADEYFSVRLHSEVWAAADEAKKQSALVMATLSLDRLVTWYGEIAADTQALCWPRIGAFDAQGRLVADDAIPAAVVAAVCEQALELLQFNSSRVPDAIKKGIGSAGVGSISASFDRTMVADRLAPYAVDAIQSSWLGEIRPGVVAGMTSNVRIVRA